MDYYKPLVATHPWIDFRFDLQRLSFHTWIALGECASMCDHIGQIPLSPEISRKLHRVYLAKGVLATTAIEGNTLSEEEVRQAVEGTLQLPESKQYLAQEVENIIAAFNRIGLEIQSGHIPVIEPDRLCEYNSQILRNLNLAEEVIPGQFRQHMVTVGRYRCPDAQYVPKLVNRLCERLDTFDEDARTLGPTVKAILKAVFAHLYVAWIHPFGDGNGRTARLVEADILLRSGIPSPAVHVLSNHYNLTRAEYYRMLDEASCRRDALSFVSYAVLGFRDGLREQREAIMNHVRDIVWINYVHDQFKARKATITNARQRHVILELSEYGKPVNLREIPTLTPVLRERYQKKGLQTLRRDVKSLCRMGLLKEDVQGDNIRYVPIRGIIDSLLPLRKK